MAHGWCTPEVNADALFQLLHDNRMVYIHLRCAIGKRAAGMLVQFESDADGCARSQREGSGWTDVGGGGGGGEW